MKDSHSILAACRLRAFSLLELLVVIAVIAVMMSLLVPAVAGFSSTAGRRGAVNIVMNTLEQARVAALESGQTVYVGFADNNFPTEDMRYASFIVFRDATDEEKVADSGRSFVVLKKWTRLPKKVAFKQIGSSLIRPSGRSFSGLARELGSTQNDENFPFVAFNSSGAVDEPAQDLRVFLYEGYFANGQEVAVRNEASGLYEKITLSRYTGRAQLDVTATGT